VQNPGAKAPGFLFLEARPRWVAKPAGYSSRTRYNTDVFRRLHNLKASLYQALIRISEENRSDHERELITQLANSTCERRP
jgi:patatin-like phospholipase